MSHDPLSMHDPRAQEQSPSPWFVVCLSLLQGLQLLLLDLCTGNHGLCLHRAAATFRKSKFVIVAQGLKQFVEF